MGKASKRLTYVDQVLQLVYEGGSPCPSKTGLSYKSVISFVCRPEVGPTNRPMLISLDKRTCTLFFSWHTPLACEPPTNLLWFQFLLSLNNFLFPVKIMILAMRVREATL